MRGFERKLRKKYSKYKLDTDLRKEYGVPQKYKMKMFQYSKVLTTFILIFTLVVNTFYFLYLIPQSGMLLVTDAAMQASATILKVWNAGTIVFFCGYFAKALFETKFERDDEFRVSEADNHIEKIKQEMNEVMDETSY